MINATKALTGVLAVSAVILTMSLSAHASNERCQRANNDEKCLKISRVIIRDVTDRYPQESATTESLAIASLNSNLMSDATPFNPGDIFRRRSGTPLDRAEVVVDQIINIGNKIWAVIERGRPVQNFNRTTATALPSGAQSWQQLENWQRPTSRVLEATYKNLWGFDAVRFVYRVILLPGGSVAGTGRYIGYAAVEPVSIYTQWGMTFNATASVPTVYNLGSRTAPVAGMIMNISWTVETVFQKFNEGHSLTLDGRGNIQPADNTRLN